MNSGLEELRALLATTPGTHVDDQRLSAIVTAELMGEDVEVHYAAELAHIEQCLVCAEAYSGLHALSDMAMADMDAAAAQVSPQAVYLALLQEDSAEAFDPEDAHKLVTAVALLFDRPPTTAAAFDAALARMPANDILIAAMRQNLAALSAFLQGTAAALWGRALDVQTAAVATGQRLQLRPGPQVLIPTLSSQETGDEWQVLSRRIGQVIPLHIGARARRSGPVACTLTVRVDRPGLAEPAGRAIQVFYGEQSATAVTDERGIATFENLPIAALAALDLIVEE